MKRVITFTRAIYEALDQAMKADKTFICFGLGVPDPKGIFGTTLGLQKKYGKDRVFDMPASENGMLGIGIGAALTGLRPVMCHLRVDFFFLAMDQLVNSAAKWHYMFNGQASVPLTIRLIVGRGWGQGPTHSQSMQAWLAHIPGLKVVMPATPADAKGLLLASIFDNNPVIFIEHRWLHETKGEVPDGNIRIPIGKAQLLRRGNDATIVTMSYMTIEALHAADFLLTKKISCEVIDLRTVSPIDWRLIFDSVKKTGRLIVLDTEWSNISISSEIVARVAMQKNLRLKSAPGKLGLPDYPTPASFALTKKYYPRAEDLVRAIAGMVGKKINAEEVARQRTTPHDLPGEWFKGPF
jgi:pyruvate dehydrogenase E1 component beta subunit